jgi:hypothetical protein
MAVLTLEPALPGERKRSQGGPLEVVLCLLVIAMITLTGLLAHRNRVMMTIPLHAITVAVGPGGNLVEVTATDQLVPGSRVLAGMPDSDDLAREQAAWLADGTVPRVPGLDSDMISAALLDLHVLSQPYGVAVAGWSEPWRYVWPRDAALVASWVFCSMCNRSPDFLRPATCPMAVVSLMIAASSSTASAGRSGLLIKWLPS